MGREKTNHAVQQRADGLGRTYAGDTDETCCFWVAEPAGELPPLRLDDLRPFRRADVFGEDRDMKRKLPAIQITRFDKKRLMRLLSSLENAPGESVETEELQRELARGTEVDSTEVAPDVITMNSTVRVTDLDSNTTSVYTIVFPTDVDVSKGRISILSPLGTALIGFRAGDVVTWDLRDGTRTLRIDEIVYQPEAAGDYHL